MKLPFLKGTAPIGSWRIGTDDYAEADGRQAIFAIVRRLPSTPLSFRGLDDGELIGTGFFVVPNGGFVTAKHVAIEAEAAMAEAKNSIGIVYALAEGRVVFRPVWRFFNHATADLAFGVAQELYDNKTRIPFRAKVLSLSSVVPELGSEISTWAYPLHRRIAQEDGQTELMLQPDFFNGLLQENYSNRGPSAKLVPPYFLTNIHRCERRSCI